MNTSETSKNKLSILAPFIVLGLLLVSLGVAAKGVSGLSYEEYCKEPQARCDLNKNTSVTQTFKNIYTTLSTGENVHQPK